jgi:putative ABC transport system permease protein
MTALIYDLRHAAKYLAYRPGWSALVVVTLALALGPNIVVFSIVYSVLLRPLPFLHPDQLVVLYEANSRRGIAQEPADDGAFPAYERQTHVFARMGAFVEPWEHWLYTSRGLHPVDGAEVSAGVFPLLGVRPLLGRTFRSQECRRNGPHVVILSYRFWMQHFGGDPRVLGKFLPMDDAGYRHDYTVVGVMPRGFAFPYPFLSSERPEVWDPLWTDWHRNPDGAHNTYIVARLKEGRSLSHAQADVALVARQMAHDYPQECKDVTAFLRPLGKQSVSTVRLPLLLLFGATGLIVLVACANVSALLLARAEDRRKETAIRAALGASLGRLCRHLLAEAALLGLLAGVLGAALAFATLPVLRRWIPSGLLIPRLGEARPGFGVFVYALLGSSAAALLSNLAPPFRLFRPDLNEVLKEARPRLGGARARGASRTGTLVAAQVALTVVLLTAAGLALKSLSKLEHLNLGFNPKRLLTARVSLPNSWTSLPRVTSFGEELLQRASGLPGVQRVALAESFPPYSFLYAFFTGTGKPMPGSTPDAAEFDVVTPSYFRIVGDQLLRGRMLTAQDNLHSPWVVIVNRALVQRYWPGQDPVGKQIAGLPYISSPRPAAYTIVGVVEEHPRFGVDNKPSPCIYAPFRQFPLWGFTALFLTRSGTTSLAGPVRQLAGSMDSEVLEDHVVSAEEMFRDSIALPKFVTDALALFGLLAFLLAALGTYGVVSHATARRTHEIAIRMALAARRGDVVRLIVGQGVFWAAIGVACGSALAVLLTEFLRSLLYAIAPTDASVYVAVALALLGVSAAACYVPARRAAGIDPAAALRRE